MCLPHLSVTLKQQKTQWCLKACWLLWLIILVQTATSHRGPWLCWQFLAELLFHQMKGKTLKNSFQKRKEKNVACLKRSQSFLFKKQYTKQKNDSMKVGEMGGGGGGMSGVICGWVCLKSTSGAHRLGSRMVQFTVERITTVDYLSRAIKSALPSSIITHLREEMSVRGEMGEEEEEQLSSHPLCYCSLMDLPDGSQDFRDYYSEKCAGVHSSLKLIL